MQRVRENEENKSCPITLPQKTLKSQQQKGDTGFVQSKYFTALLAVMTG